MHDIQKIQSALSKNEMYEKKKGIKKELTNKVRELSKFLI